MTDINPHIDAAAYALDSLDGSERAGFEAHLRSCLACRADVKEFRSVVGVLGHAASSVVPPAALRERILASARAARPSGLRRTGFPLAWFAVAASLGVAVLGGLAYRAERARGIELASDLAFARVELAGRDSLLGSFMGPEVHVVSLGLPGRKPSARVFWNHTRNIFVVTAFDIPPAPTGKTYQLWAITKDKAPMSMGTFNTDRDGRATTVVPVDVQVLAAGFIDNCALTIEPSGGSPQPTEQPRMVGVWRHVD
jgi:anti-sigma-K factor RskA